MRESIAVDSRSRIIVSRVKNSDGVLYIIGDGQSTIALTLDQYDFIRRSIEADIQDHAMRFSERLLCPHCNGWHVNMPDHIQNCVMRPERAK